MKTTERQLRDREAARRLGEVIRARRKELGFNLVPFAKVADMTWSQLGRIERGDSYTGPGTYRRIAQELGWTPADLYGRAFPDAVRRGSGRPSRRVSGHSR